MYLNIEQDYKEKIDAIWAKQIERHPETRECDIVRLGYAIERLLKQNDVLFLGMNPSYKEGEWNNGGAGFYDIIAGNPYFQTLISFSKETIGVEQISHHDMLYIRHTNQKEVINFFDDYIYKDFILEQLLLSRDIICAAEPKLIVVLNAGVREIIKNLFRIDLNNDFDDELGAYIIDIGKRVPVIFTGMLSGQRALDLGSKRTLQWQIQRLLRNN